MRRVLDEIMRSKDPLQNPDKIKEIDEQISSQQDMLRNSQKENKDLFEIIKAKDVTIAKQEIDIKERDSRIEKMKGTVKDSRHNQFMFRKQAKTVPKR